MPLEMWRDEPRPQELVDELRPMVMRSHRLPLLEPRQGLPAERPTKRRSPRGMRRLNTAA